MVAVILNPASGAARRPGLPAEIQQLFDQTGLEATIQQLSSPAEISRASAAAAASADAVIAAGGDGTINAVATPLAGGPTPLGVLPLGSLNHFARDLQIPGDLARAVRIIADRHTRRVDVGRVADRIFLNNLSIGVYPSIIEAREQLRRDGRSKWIAFALATLQVLRGGNEIAFRVQAHQSTIQSRTPFLFVGNNEYLAEGLHLGARTRLDGRRLCAYFAPPVRTRDLPKLFAHAVLGRARQAHVLQAISADELWVEMPGARTIKVGCDGELMTFATPLHFRSWPGALTVLAPR